MADRIALIGPREAWTEAPVARMGGWEWWSFNTWWDAVPLDRFSRWFELHDIDEMYGSGEQSIDMPEHISWVLDSHRGIDLTLLPSQMRHYGTRTSNALDTDGLIEEFGDYITNSVSWMLAEAITQNPDTIGLYGMDFDCQHEIVWERPSVEYFIGIAKGRGIEVLMPESTSLLYAPFLYGVDQVQDQRHILRRRIADYEERAAKARRTAHQHEGAAMEARVQVEMWEHRWQA